MARIRTIKPEFPHSESMGNVSRDARLAFILMWTIADDSGRLRGNSRMLASLLFPYDDDAAKKIDSWINELHDQKCIIRYRADGAEYIQIQKWLEHQRIDKPSASKIPPFQEGSENVREDSERIPVRKGREGKGVEGSGNDKRASKKLTLDELSVVHISDWISEKRAEGKYINHDENFILEYFKNYCKSKGKKYDDYIAAYRNAFEWDSCQPKQRKGGDPATNAYNAAQSIIARRNAAAGINPSSESINFTPSTNLCLPENIR